MPLRVILFIDNQNVYMGARRAFFGEQTGVRRRKRGRTKFPFASAAARHEHFFEGESARRPRRKLHNRYGNVWPHLVGELVGEASNAGSGEVEDRVLEQVRVYYGLPSPHHDPVGHAATVQRAKDWKRQDSRIETIPHDLMYSSEEDGQSRPREKGVDVALAVDFIDFAHLGAYDIGIIFSSDTDFRPALLRAREIGRVVEEVQWWNEAGQHTYRIVPSEEGIVCHKLSAAHYKEVCAHRRLLRPFA